MAITQNTGRSAMAENTLGKSLEILSRTGGERVRLNAWTDDEAPHGG
jgi:hypothetical protein